MGSLNKDIDLLPQREFEKSPIGKFLKWALTIGRYIVIFTELIVVISFLSRFKLDSDLGELNKNITEKQMIIDSFGELEKKTRSLQDRFEIIKNKKEVGIKAVRTLDGNSSIIPPDVVLSELSIQGSSLSLQGIAFSHQGLAALIEGFRQSELFDEIDVRRVVSKGEDLEIKFEIYAKLT